ncbi:hypothetical protein SCALM49S_04632 [Streptomyces californicus]
MRNLVVSVLTELAGEEPPDGYDHHPAAPPPLRGDRRHRPRPGPQRP